jgi:hypothetical protein
MRYGPLLCVLGVQACVAMHPMWTPAARTSANTCGAPDAPASAPPWQLVRGQGFTFCVPADWHSSDGHTWRSRGSLLGWCTPDRPDQCPNVAGYISGPIVTNQAQTGAAALVNEGGGCSSDRFREDVSGALATLFDQYCEGRHVTGIGWWSGPSVEFLGQTDDAVAARLQLQVYRTVRFTAGAGGSPSPPRALPPN